MLATLALSHRLKPGTGAATVPAVNYWWRRAFSNAQYVLLTSSAAKRIAWTPALKAYLASHFTVIYRSSQDLNSPRYLNLYVRRGLRTGCETSLIDLVSGIGLLAPIRRASG